MLLNAGIIDVEMTILLNFPITCGLYSGFMNTFVYIIYVFVYYIDCNVY